MSRIRTVAARKALSTNFIFGEQMTLWVRVRRLAGGLVANAIKSF